MSTCQSLGDLYRSHSIELLQFARRRVGAQEAEDVVQDAYLNIIQRNHGDRVENPRAYLFRVTANAAIDQMRRLKVRSSQAADEDIEFERGSSSGVSAADPVSLSRLRVALAELPPPQRSVLILNCFEGLTYGEIASRLGVSVRTIDRLLLKALKHLRERLGES